MLVLLNVGGEKAWVISLGSPWKLASLLDVTCNKDKYQQNKGDMFFCGFFPYITGNTVTSHLPYTNSISSLHFQ